jgi:hypothetical protein
MFTLNSFAITNTETASKKTPGSFAPVHSAAPDRLS